MNFSKLNIKNIFLSFAIFFAIGTHSVHADVAWTTLPGAAVDVGAGGNGQVWVVNSAQDIFRFSNGTWGQGPGKAVRVAVDPQGNAWVVNSAGAVFQWVNNNWAQRPGTMLDIGVGASGAVWAIGTNQQIYRWTGSAWAQMPVIPEVGILRVSVDPQGNPWVLTDLGPIYTWSNNRWMGLPLINQTSNIASNLDAAKDLAVCGNRDVYVVNKDRNLYKLNGSQWEKQAGAGFLNISCDDAGRLFATLTNFQILRGVSATPIASIAATSANTAFVSAATDNAQLAASRLAKAHIAAAGKKLDVVYATQQVNLARADANNVRSRSSAMAAMRPIQWVDAEYGQVPQGAVFGSIENNGTRFAVCRANYRGGLLPGKVVGRFCNVAADGQEVQVFRYQVAVGQMGWITGSDGSSTPEAIIGGRVIPSLQWSQMPGYAVVDVGAGGNGQVWVTNSAQAIFRWSNGSWGQAPGAAVRVAVDPQGNAWVVNSAGAVFQWVNNNWAQRPGTMSDIGVGANGVVWAIGTNQQIYRWTGFSSDPQVSNAIEEGFGIKGSRSSGRSDWALIPKSIEGGSIVGIPSRISVDPQGNAWVVDDVGRLYSWSNNVWRMMSQPSSAVVIVAATDVAACGNRDVYVIGYEANRNTRLADPEKKMLYKWNGSNFEKQTGSNFLNLSCDGQGKVFSTLKNNLIFSASVSALTPSGQLTICRAPYSGGIHIGQLHTTSCVITYGGNAVPINNYQVAVDIGATAGNLNQYMVTAADSSLNTATAILQRVTLEAEVAEVNAIQALQQYRNAVANAASAQANSGVVRTTTLASGEINYVAMVSGSANLGGGVSATGSTGLDYGVNGQITSTGASGSYTYTAESGGSVTYGDSRYNTTISGLARLEQQLSGCIGVNNNSACFNAAAKNTASLEAKLGSNVALGRGTTLSSSVTGTLSSGFYGSAGFQGDSTGGSGGVEGSIGSSATAEYNYGVYNDSYGGAGVKAGFSAGGAVGGGGSGSVTYTNGTLKLGVCGSGEFILGLDLCVDGAINLGAAYEPLSPVLMKGAPFLIEVAPGVYRTSATAVQGAGLKAGDYAVNTIAQGSISAADAVASRSISNAKRIAARTVSSLYTAGAVTAGSAYKVVKEGQIAADVVAHNAQRASVIKDVAQSTANTVAVGIMNTANTVGDGIRSGFDTIRSWTPW